MHPIDLTYQGSSVSVSSPNRNGSVEFAYPTTTIPMSVSFQTAANNSNNAANWSNNSNNAANWSNNSNNAANNSANASGWVNSVANNAAHAVDYVVDAFGANSKLGQVSTSCQPSTGKIDLSNAYSDKMAHLAAAKQAKRQVRPSAQVAQVASDTPVKDKVCYTMEQAVSHYQQKKCEGEMRNYFEQQKWDSTQLWSQKSRSLAAMGVSKSCPPPAQVCSKYKICDNWCPV